MINNIAQSAFFKVLDKIKYGKITIIFHGISHEFTGKSAEHPQATLTINDADAFSKTVFGGDVGFAESYIDGLWECNELDSLMQIFALNINHMFKSKINLDIPRRIVEYFYSLSTRNSKAQAKRNILAHYDLGNDFFATFLDPKMMYSSAIYDQEHSSLNDAQQNRIAIIGQRLNIQSGDSIIEIGSGWGGVAIHLAQNYDCHVTTTTISEQQYIYVKEKIAKLNLQDKITLLKEDYRDLTGQYDKLVSIEMIEAVGAKYLGEYFKKCNDLLKDNGLMLLQAITISDQRYKSYKNNVDFIQKYIFPGSHVPSLTAITNTLTAKTDMNMVGLHDFTDSYAKTLNAWRMNFNDKVSELKKMGFDEQFQRMWNYYFCYCEGGFKARSIQVVHALIAKQRWNISS